MQGDARAAIERLKPHAHSFDGPKRHERFALLNTRFVWLKGSIAMAAAMLGDFTLADGAIAEAFAVARESGRPQDRHSSLQFALQVEIARGPSDSILAEVETVLADSLEEWLFPAGPWLLCSLGVALILRGRTEAAGAALERALEAADSAGMGGIAAISVPTGEGPPRRYPLGRLAFEPRVVHAREAAPRNTPARRQETAPEREHRAWRNGGPSPALRQCGCSMSAEHSCAQSGLIRAGMRSFARTVQLALRILAAAVLVSGCYQVLPSSGGGQTAFSPPRVVRAADVLVPDGYQVEAVATGLTFPTGIAFDAAGTPYITEAGYSYGEVFLKPRLVRIGPGGERDTVAEVPGNGPWNGVVWHEGAFYVAEGGELDGGRILRIIPGQAPVALVAGLPSVGDHHTNGPAVGPDGWIYFGQGTATNSAVVGMDSHDFGWLERYPRFHDVPCRAIALTGVNYTTPNPLTVADDVVVTGAYVPFGTPTSPGQVVPGAVPCNGAVLRVRPEGGPVELVAWGFRNPFALAFSPDGTLYVTENGYDERGSRPVWGTADHLWGVEAGRWYGWPDYSGGQPLAQSRYAPPGDSAPQRVLANPPGQPPRPLAYLGVHSSSNGLDVAPSRFGHEGEVFIAQFGDMAPDVGKVMAPVGFRVVRVDPATGVVQNFAVNRGGTGPASLLNSGGLERPVALRFSRDGSALYVVDFGVMLMTEDGPSPKPGTGVLWRIGRAG